MESSDYITVEVGESRAFIEKCMVATGASPDHSAILAELLVSADERGHFSHGIMRLDFYVRDIEAEVTAKDGEPVVLKEKAGTAWVDGCNLLGPVVGKFCTDLAIRKAKEAGIGCVVAKGSNHYGIAGWYAMRIMEAGMIGFSFTNATPIVVPTRSREGILGTNPISCSAPGQSGDSFVLDMATSTVAHGKLDVCKVKGQPIPNGWGCDSSGKETNDPDEVNSGGGLLPLGGMEVTGGYKGFGLGMMVEILTGVLGGGKFGTECSDWRKVDGIADRGHCFIAINLEGFVPGFPDRLSTLMTMCRESQLAEGETDILVAGDPERSHMAEVAKGGGIKYHRNVINKLDQLASRLGVDHIKRL